MIVSYSVHRRQSIRLRLVIGGLLAAFSLSPVAHGFERVTLRNGFSYDCGRRETLDSTHIRLFLTASDPVQASSPNFIDLPSDSIAAIETLPDPVLTAPTPVLVVTPTLDIPTLLANAGSQHNIDAELLASIVHNESGGRANAVSRAGARGLMQLMPGTAQQLGVDDAFQPGQNIAGGSTYLDELLTRYHDNLSPRPGRLQRRPRRRRPLPRRPALPRNPRLRGPRHARVQAPQARPDPHPHSARLHRRLPARLTLMPPANTPAAPRLFGPKTLIPIAVVLIALAVWLARSHVSFNVPSLFHQLRAVSPLYILAALACTYLGYWLRAWRWSVLLAPLRKTTALEMLPSQLIGFTIVGLFGRFADLARPYLIARRLQTSVATQLAVYSIERAFDLAAAAILFSVTLAFAPRDMPHHEAFVRAGAVSLAATLFLAAFALALRFAGPRVAALAERLLSPISKSFAASASLRILEFSQGLRIVSSVSEFLAALALSLAMWLLIALMYLASAHAFRAGSRPREPKLRRHHASARHWLWAGRFSSSPSSAGSPRSPSWPPPCTASSGSRSRPPPLAGPSFFAFRTSP